MDKNKKMMVWTVVVILIIILGIWIYESNKNMQSSAPTSSTSLTAATPTPSPTPTPTSAVGSITYENAVTKYVGHRIQFNSSCQAIPTQITFRNPTTIMLDNRSAVTEKITLAGVTHTIGAYNFAIVTINEAKLPATLYANCNAEKNVLTVLMQK